MIGRLFRSRARPAPGDGFMMRLARDERGLSAVEFALLAPVLIVMYFGLSEVCQGFMSQKRAAHSAAMVADMVAQTDTVTTTELDDIFAIGNLIMRPFSASTLTSRITSVTRDSKGVARVGWSRGSGMAARASNAVVSSPSIPAGLIANGESLIMSETIYTYTSPVKSIIPAPIKFSNVYYLRPRRVVSVTCSDCPTT